MSVTSPSQMPSPERIFQTLNAHHQTATLKAAIEMDLFTVIDEGNHSTAELAKRLNASERGVRILSDNLVINGFLKKENSGYWLTPESALFLSKRSPQYLGTIAEFLSNRQHVENMARLADAVRRGGTVNA